MKVSLLILGVAKMSNTVPGVMMILKANSGTWMKKTEDQADDLPNTKKKWYQAGDTLAIESLRESESEPEPDAGVVEASASIHLGVTLAYGQGDWFVWMPHWDLEHMVALESPLVSEKKRPEWNEVDWKDFSAPVSRYFTVGEVTNMSTERIPTSTDIKKNIITIARHMDEIREWWGGPLGVNSWYRPWRVNTRIGSRAPNHPGGYAVDFRPLNGSVHELQRRFKKEWYDTGKWKGGFGLGAHKGFVHIDLRGKRVWNY